MSKRLYRISAFVIAICMLVLACPAFLTACGTSDDGVEILTVRDIVLDTTNAKVEYAYGEEFSAEGLKVTAILSDGSEREIPLEKCRISKVKNTPGKRKVSVTYAKKTKRYEVVFADKPMPPISAEPLLEIAGDKTDGAYRVQAEAIDLATSGVLQSGGELIVESESADGGKYIANYGNTNNYFGFTFNSTEAKDDVTLVIRVANPSTEHVMQVGSNILPYLNYAGTSNSGAIGIMRGAAIAKASETDGLVWSDFVVRGLKIKEGANTLTFGVLDGVVPCIDYFDFYVGKYYSGSSLELAAAGESTALQFEEFGLERVTTREDYLETYHLEQGELCVLDNVGADGGKAAFALMRGEVSTVITAAENSTVQLIMSAASGADWKFIKDATITLDGEKIKFNEHNIRAGDPEKGEIVWKDTDLGFYDLTAGEHLLHISIDSPHANFDALTVKTVSKGAFMEKHPEVYIDGAGTFVMEGEHLDPSGVVARDDYAELVIGQPYGAYNVISDKRASGGRAIDGFTGKPVTATHPEAENTVFTFDFYLAEAATVDVNAVAASQLGVNFAIRDHVIVRIDGLVMSPNACNLAQYWNDGKIEFDDPMFLDTRIAHRNLAAGRHTLKIEVINFFFILDCIKINVLSYGEYAPDVVIDGLGEFYVEAEGLDPTGAIARKDFIDAGRILSERDEYCIEAADNPHGGYNICGLDTGSKLTTYFELEDKATVRILMGAKSNLGIAIWEKTHVKFVLDEKVLTPNAQNVMNANNNSWIELEIDDLVNLDKGSHKLEIVLVGFSFELDYIKFDVTDYGTQRTMFEIANNGDVVIQAENTDGREAIIRDDFKPYMPNDKDKYGVFEEGSVKYILGMQTGSKIKIYFTVKAKCTVALYMNARGGNNSGCALWDASSGGFTLNGVNMQPAPNEASRLSGEFKDVLLFENKSLEAGDYTYCVELKSFTDFNIDYFKFVVSGYGE